MKLNKFLIVVFAFLLVCLMSVNSVQAADDYAITAFNTSKNSYDVDEQVTFTITVANIGTATKNAGNVGPEPLDIGDIFVDFDDGANTTLYVKALTVGTSKTYTIFHTYSQEKTYIPSAEISIRAPTYLVDNPANNFKTTSFDVLETYDVPIITEITDKVLVKSDTEWTYQVDVTSELNIVEYNVSLNAMTISSTGLIRYVPNVVGTFPVVVTVKDSMNQIDTESFSITVQEDKGIIEITESSIILGSFNAIRGQAYTKDVVIRNAGTQTLNNFELDLKTLSGTNITSSVVSHSALPTTLAPGQSYTLTLSGTLPTTIDGGVSQLYGRFELKANSLDGLVSTGIKNIYFQAETGLVIDEVELYVNGDKEETLSNGEKFDEFKEGDEIKLVLMIENDFDFDIEDVFVESISDDSDWDFVEEESDEMDIDEGDDGEFELSFTIDPSDLDEDSDDSVTITLVVSGDATEYNYKHYAEMTFTLEFDREDDEITLTNVFITPTTLSCDGGQVTLEVDFKNTGEDDQDDSYIIVKSTDLNYNNKYMIGDDFESKDDDSHTFYITVPSKSESKTYYIEILAYNDDDDVTDSEIVEVQLVCGTPTEDDDDDDTSDGITVQPTNEYPTTGNYGEFVQGQASFRDSAIYVTLLVILAILVVAGIIMLLAVMLKKN